MVLAQAFLHSFIVIHTKIHFHLASDIHSRAAILGLFSTLQSCDVKPSWYMIFQSSMSSKPGYASSRKITSVRSAIMALLKFLFLVTRAIRLIGTISKAGEKRLVFRYQRSLWHMELAVWALLVEKGPRNRRKTAECPLLLGCFSIFVQNTLAPGPSFGRSSQMRVDLRGLSVEKSQNKCTSDITTYRLDLI